MVLYIMYILLYRYSDYRSIKGEKMFNKRKKGRRNKSEWESMNPSELTRLMANRYARIEILKMEIKQLQKLIEKKSKD